LTSIWKKGDIIVKISAKAVLLSIFLNIQNESFLLA